MCWVVPPLTLDPAETIMCIISNGCNSLVLHEMRTWSICLKGLKENVLIWRNDAELGLMVILALCAPQFFFFFAPFPQPYRVLQD